MRTGYRNVLKSYRGFTLIELMIALLIGIFLLGALLTIVQTNRTVFGDQNKMSQLQDAERMAMTMMTDVIQSAGYFPAPVYPSYVSLADALPASDAYAASFASGQTITGQSLVTPSSDQLSVRYMTANNDGILNCSGTDNSTGGNVLYVNTFQVQNGQLVCTLNGTPYTLVGDGISIIISNLSILYGVKANAAATGNSVDTYYTAAQINGFAPALWNSVISVTIQLTFNNPMYTPGTAQPQTILVQRVVSVMNQSGPME